MEFRPFCQRAIPWLVLVLAVCVAIQAVLGGYAAWTDTSVGGAHTAFVHVFELIPLLLAGAAFVVRDWRAGVLGLVLFFLIGAQYGLIRADEVVRPLHIANAFLIFGIVLAMAQARWGRRRVGAASVA